MKHLSVVYETHFVCLCINVHVCMYVEGTECIYYIYEKLLWLSHFVSNYNPMMFQVRASLKAGGCLRTPYFPASDSALSRPSYDGLSGGDFAEASSQHRLPLRCRHLGSGAPQLGQQDQVRAAFRPRLHPHRVWWGAGGGAEPLRREDSVVWPDQHTKRGVLDDVHSSWFSSTRCTKYIIY